MAAAGVLGSGAVRLGGGFVGSWAGAAYCYFLLRCLPTGSPRLLACIPVFVLYSLLPLLFNRETHVIGVAFCFCAFTWMGSFKALLLCWDRGPLCDPWVLRGSFLRFALVMSFPLHLRREGRTVKKHSGTVSPSWVQCVMEEETWPMPLLRSLLKLALLVLLDQRALPLRHSLPRFAIYALYSVILYLFVTTVLETLAAVANSVLGARLEPHFDNPFAAASLQQFWALRWNLLVSNSLRDVVYEPLLAALTAHSRVAPLQSPTEQTATQSDSSSNDLKQSLRHRSSPHDVPGYRAPVDVSQLLGSDHELHVGYRAAKFWAMLATFFVSGLAHELAVYYLTLQITGEMTAFFTLHGLATGVEAAWSSYAPNVKPPNMIRRFLALGFCYMTACWLFWPPVTRGADEKAIGEMHSMLTLLAAYIRLLIGSTFRFGSKL